MFKSLSKITEILTFTYLTFNCLILPFSTRLFFLVIISHNNFFFVIILASEVGLNSALASCEKVVGTLK